MGPFVSRKRRGTTVGHEARDGLRAEVRMGLPPRFDAVGEALASGSDPVPACRVVGRDLALDGASTEEALAALQATWRTMTGDDPAYPAVAALLGAWGDTTLSYLHRLSCADPMTGLATLAHVRTRLAELYRGPAADDLNAVHALVVCELTGDHEGSPRESFTRAMHLARVGDTARTVFAGPETIGRLGARRVVVVADRDARLGARVRLLRTLLGDADLGTRAVRVWIEGLPGSDATAALLLDELARS